MFEVCVLKPVSSVHFMAPLIFRFIFKGKGTMLDSRQMPTILLSFIQ